MMHINLWLVRFDSKQSNTYYQNVVSLGDELVNRNDNSYELVDMNRSSFIFKGGTKESLFEIAQNINSNEIFDQTAIFPITLPILVILIEPHRATIIKGNF